jgi:hypothetical protein
MTEALLPLRPISAIVENADSVQKVSFSAVLYSEAGQGASESPLPLRGNKFL